MGILGRGNWRGLLPVERLSQFEAISLGPLGLAMAAPNPGQERHAKRYDWGQGVGSPFSKTNPKPPPPSQKPVVSSFHVSCLNRRGVCCQSRSFYILFYPVTPLTNLFFVFATTHSISV